MKQSFLLTKTKKETPSDEISKNAIFLLRAGFVYKEAAGIYSYLPLGLRVLNKITSIIRDEMDKLGGQEAHLSVLQNPEPWKKSGRWELPVWFKTKLSDGGSLGLGWTHEEAFANIMTEHIHSYKDLPKAVYQIQDKFRNEERAKSGMLRGREFYMKDLYSFHSTENDLDSFYNMTMGAYKNIFDRVGIGKDTFMTLSSGGAFSKYSHEFQTLSESGEDIIFLSREKKIAINKEILSDEVLSDMKIKQGELEEAAAIEVGNIFKLGTRFSESAGLMFSDEKGLKKFVTMGSYGIGPGRLLGTIVEKYADEKGIAWPKNVAPFEIHLLQIGESEEIKKISESFYNKLKEKNIEILYDDREEASAGEKFADSDLIGIPTRVVISKKSISQGGIEIKTRDSAKTNIVLVEDFIKNI